MNSTPFNFHWLARSIKSIGHAIGLDIRSKSKMAPVDLTKVIDLHPIEAAYRAETRNFLVRVSLQKCLHMGYLASTCGPSSSSPYIRTLQEYSDLDHDQYSGSMLQRFFSLFHPENAAKLMGLNPACNISLSNTHPLGTPWFFMACDPNEQLSRTKVRLVLENQEHGAKRLGASDGYHLFGPVTDAKGQLEFQRLITIHGSVKSEGLKFNTAGIDNITGVYLLHEDQWQIFILNGQHRVAAAAANNLSDIVMEIGSFGCGGIVRRSDSVHWPLVRSGLIQLNEGIELFDRIFEGSPPPEATDWINCLGL